MYLASQKMWTQMIQNKLNTQHPQDAPNFHDEDHLQQLSTLDTAIREKIHALTSASHETA